MSQAPSPGQQRQREERQHHERGDAVGDLHGEEVHRRGKGDGAGQDREDCELEHDSADPAQRAGGRPPAGERPRSQAKTGRSDRR